MNFFNFDFKKLVLIGIVLTLPLLSINMQQRPQESHWLVKPFSLLGSTVSEAFFGFSHGIKSTTAMYVDLINIKKQSQDLHSVNNELQARLQKMNELTIENNRLRDLLTFKQQTKMNLTSAQVIGRDLVIDHNTITINKGTKDGLKAGQAVITVSGVLGYIFKPEPFTSHVMLITDRYAVVDGIVQRTRAHGIVEGKSQKSCALKYVERTEDVKAGDLVVTGGLDNIFPKGFPVAIVQSVERKTFSVSLKVDLRPVIDPHNVEEVFIVIDAAKEDFADKYLQQSNLETVIPEANQDPATSTQTATATPAVATNLPTAGAPPSTTTPSITKPANLPNIVPSSKPSAPSATTITKVAKVTDQNREKLTEKTAEKRSTPTNSPAKTSQESTP